MEVVLALAAELRRVCITLAEGATVEQALRASGLVETLDADLPVGVLGRLRKLQDTVQDGDRVEIYRGLLVDPKAARRQRAARRKLRGAARPD